ncbi:MAG: hypothetical protein JRI80_12500 [Deltaproteobacteria bacterium]|nr:hypothetical protein [Deltaproteobacteria bacterium]
MTKTVEDEQVSQSEFSPGPVEDCEILIRIIVSPHHFKEGDTFLERAAFIRSELTGRGVSIERKALTNPTSLTHSSHKLLTAEDRSVAGYALVECSSIRGIVDDMGDRIFCVLDTALECNPAHADIFFAKEIPRSKQVKYRDHMMDAFNEMIRVHGTLYKLEEIFAP